jgi:hypothetical protein
LLIVGLLAVTPARSSDLLCQELADFAAATSPGQERSVSLTTDWGGPLSHERNAVFVKACRHDQEAQGQRLCKALTEKASAEVPVANLNRVLGCLKLGALPPPKHASIERISLRLWAVSASVAADDNPPEIGVDYVSGTRETPTVMQVLTRRGPAMQAPRKP